MFSKKEFDIAYLLKDGGEWSQREIADRCGMSLGMVNKTIGRMRENGIVSERNVLTPAGRQMLDRYKVENAIILAAGMSTRFVPVSYEFPKGLTVVKGEVLIERQIRQLHEAGVKNVVVVIGHMLEKFFYLKDKYNVLLVVNNEYKIRNTHSSLFAARDYLRNSYICCSDNYYPENLFRSHEYRSMYCAQFLEGESRTERGLITNNKGLIIETCKPCRDAWTMQGHAFLNAEFCAVFKKILEDYHSRTGTEGLYWEGIYAENLSKLPMYMVKCDAHDILEFDSVEDLRAFDPDYIVHNDLKVIRNICSVLDASVEEIRDISPIAGGLTNKTFSFVLRGGRYTYRNPGKSTIGYIDRERENFVQKIAKGLGIDDSFIHENEREGWKVSRYVDVTEPFSFDNSRHVGMLCDHLHVLHQSGIRCGSAFDFFEEADKLIGRLEILDPWAAQDVREIRERILPVRESILRDNWPIQLCHNDIYEPNLLVSGDRLYLIDWEYAGDSDIGYDLGKLFAVVDAPVEEIDARLSAYYGRVPTREEKKHIVGCTAVNYYYWYVWAVYQSRSANDCTQWQMTWYDKMNKYLKEAVRLAGEE